jgi:ubiquinone/menaquinone biosynthesis C-methylase UbiE
MKNKVISFEDYYKRKTIKLIYEINVKKNTFKDLIKLVNIPTENIKILDIGFGSGEILFSFNQTNELNGIDYSLNATKRSIKRAKKEGYKHFNFIRQDISNSKPLPFKKEYFDIIICSHVIQYIRNDSHILKEMRRLIKLNGRIVIGMPIREEINCPKNQQHYELNEFIQRLRKLGLKDLYILKNDSLSNIFSLINKTEKLPQLKFILSVIANTLLSLIPWVILNKLDRSLIKRGIPERQAFLVIKRIDNQVYGNLENKKIIHTLK